MDRREFSKKMFKFGLGGSAAAAIALKEMKDASANTGQRYVVEHISACESRGRWCSANGQCSQWSYYTENNCLRFGLSARCCG